MSKYLLKYGLGQILLNRDDYLIRCRTLPPDNGNSFLEYELYHDILDVDEKFCSTQLLYLINLKT